MNPKTGQRLKADLDTLKKNQVGHFYECSISKSSAFLLPIRHSKLPKA